MGVNVITKHTPLDLIDGSLKEQERRTVALGSKLVHEEIIWRSDSTAGSRPGDGRGQDSSIPAVLEIIGVNSRCVGSCAVGEDARSQSDKKGLYVLKLVVGVSQSDFRVETLYEGLFA